MARREPGSNTLVDFRYRRRFRAESGAPGGGANMTGRSGGDLEIPVPVGTVVDCEDTGERLGELLAGGERLLVARGGRRGVGNTRFKSSTNRTPRQFTRGTPGEERTLRLELKVLADVGLVGLPNAGKSTLLASLSAARPRIADYPFTTLHPHLGVVRVEGGRSFVMADIPGLIEGASEGAGLGHRFLRHVSRSRLLLHVLDGAPEGGPEAVLDGIRTIEEELRRFDPELGERPRWVVLNKIDLLPPEEREGLAEAVRAALQSREGAQEDGGAAGGQGREPPPVWAVSAATGEGTQALARAVMSALEALPAPMEGAPGQAAGAPSVPPSVPDPSPDPSPAGSSPGEEEPVGGAPGDRGQALWGGAPGMGGSGVGG